MFSYFLYIFNAHSILPLVINILFIVYLCSAPLVVSVCMCGSVMCIVYVSFELIFVNQIN